MTTLDWGERTYVMGVINVTADSFSGDGIALPGRDESAIVEAAVQQGLGFVEAGADILDVGAESSRPAQFYGEHPLLDPEVEAAVAVPVVEALVEAVQGRVLVSIDTTKGEVARRALDAGASIVNDVWGGRRDPGTVAAAADAGAHMVVMHNRDRADYAGSVFDAVLAWLSEAVDAAVAGGVPRDRVIVDPGIGFGKSPQHSIEVLHRLPELKAALGGLPMLVGTSRKRFIGELLGGAAPDKRLEGTIASTVLAMAGGADIVRVHDVEPLVKAVRVADSIVRWHG